MTIPFDLLVVFVLFNSCNVDAFLTLSTSIEAFLGSVAFRDLAVEARKKQGQRQTLVIKTQGDKKYLCKRARKNVCQWESEGMCDLLAAFVLFDSFKMVASKARATSFEARLGSAALRDFAVDAEMVKGEETEKL